MGPKKLRIERSMLQEIIRPGDGIPSWYGVAFIEEPWGNAICYPFGIHILVRWARLLYESIQIPRRTWWEMRLMDASDLAYDRGVVIGKSMGTNIDDRQVFSRSQLNQRIAVAVDKAKAIERIPNDEAYGRGYHAGWAAALVRIGELADLEIARREAALAKRVDPNEAQAKRAESDKYSEELQTDHGTLGKPWDPRGHY